MRRAWRWGIAAAITLAAVAATAVIWLRYDFEKVNWAWGVVAGFIAVYLVLDQAFKNRDLGDSALAARRRAVADHLADLVRRDPAEDGLLRSLEEPYPLPVAWRTAPDDLQPSWRTIGRSSDATRIDLSGRADTLRACFDKVPSGRLLLLGQPGSGKSIMALRLARDLATDRTAEGPVPVLLSISSWGPDTPFHDWLVVRIASRYPRLGAAHPRWEEVLRDLVETDLILPILDGLDEASEEHATRCLEELNKLPTQRLVLTCRTATYERHLAQGEKLRGAAVIEIEPLDPAKVADYLVDAAPYHQVPNWSLLADELAAAPDADLTAALSTPLMVAMARTAYDEPGSDPQELSVLAAARGRQAVEDELLTNAVYAALRSRLGRRMGTRWQPDAAHQYLSFLAAHLDALGQREFRWWRLPAAVPRAVWVLFDGLRGALAVVVALQLADTALRATTRQSAPEVGTVVGLFTDHAGWWAVLAGAGLALLSMVNGNDGGVTPSRIVFRGGWWPLVWGLSAGLVAGLFWGGAAWVALWLLDPPRRLAEFLDRYAMPAGGWPDDIAVALTVGLVALVYLTLRDGLRLDLDSAADDVGAISAAHQARDDRTATAFTLIRRVAIAVVAMYALFGALWLTGALPDRPSLAAQASAGVGIGLGLWLWTQAGSAWVRFGIARVVLAVRGKVPPRLLGFLEFGDAVGLLRGVGGAYRFRHGRLQSNLANSTDEAMRGAWLQVEFASELGRVGYWYEALDSFGAVLTARAGTIGFDDRLAAETLRKTVLAGCAGRRWRRTSEFLATLPAPARGLAEHRVPAEMAAKRREISALVSADAPLETLLEHCDDLIDLEVLTGGIEPSTLEFRAALLYAMGEQDAAYHQLRRMVASLSHADDVERSTPVGSALLARIALDADLVGAAVVLCQHELRPRYTAPETDLLLLAEAWGWSVRVVGRVSDELADLQRRLRAAVRRAEEAGPVNLTRRELVELALIPCHRLIGQPLIGGLALLAAQRLTALVDDGDSYRLAIDRTAPMWD
jgi:hypothetical protein